MTAFDEQSSSLIKLNNSTVLYLREVNKFLALVCILREYSFSRQGVIDFNFLCFRDAIHKVFEIRTIKKLALNESYDEDTQRDPDDDDVDEDDEEEDDDDDLEEQNGRQYQSYESDDDSKIGNNHNYRINLQNH